MPGRVRLLLDLIRFNHTVFALPFALTSATLAWRMRWREGAFSWPEFFLELAGILLCMVFARSTAMAFNRLVDRDLDAANPRTAMRHLPAGLIAPWSVWLFTLVCAAGFVGSTTIFIVTADNYWPLYLSTADPSLRCRLLLRQTLYRALPLLAGGFAPACAAGRLDCRAGNGGSRDAGRPRPRRVRLGGRV